MSAIPTTSRAGNAGVSWPWRRRRSGAMIVGRRYHFHMPGVAYAVVTLVLVLGAVNGQNNLLFWLFGLAVAGLVTSGVLSGGALMGLEVEREVAPVTAVGDELVIRYRVRNRSWLFPAFALTIEEAPSMRRARFTGNWKGRLSPPVAFGAHVPVRGSAVFETRVTAMRRGVATLGPIRIWTTFPFGLTRKSIGFHQPAEVLVRPRPAPVRPGLVQATTGLGEAGSRYRRARTGDEFYSLREYASGDTIRSVAWRSTARLGYAIVKDMAARPSRRVWIMLDLACVGDAAEDKCERAISVAAALGIQAQEAGLEPGLALAGGRCLELARPGKRQVGQMLDALARLNAAEVQGEQFPPLGLGAWRHDAFVLVEAQRGSGSLPTPTAVRVNVDDAGIYGASPGWSALIEGPGPEGRRSWPDRLARWVGLAGSGS